MMKYLQFLHRHKKIIFFLQKCDRYIKLYFFYFAEFYWYFVCLLEVFKMIIIVIKIKKILAINLQQSIITITNKSYRIYYNNFITIFLEKKIYRKELSATSVWCCGVWSRQNDLLRANKWTRGSSARKLDVEHISLIVEKFYWKWWRQEYRNRLESAYTMPVYLATQTSFQGRWQ